MALSLNLNDEHQKLSQEVNNLVAQLPESTLKQIYQLTIGEIPNVLRQQFINQLSRSYNKKHSIAGTEDKDSTKANQLELFGVKETQDPNWNNIIPLKEFLLQDLKTLLKALPGFPS